MKKLLSYLVCSLACIVISAQTITGYRYWYDNDFSNAAAVNGSFGADYLLDNQFSVTQLPDGLHVFNISFKESSTLWSSISSSFFYKQTSSTAANSNISQYQYWFDNDFQSNITINVTPASNLELPTDISTDNLSNGLHVFNVRFKDSNGLWSVVKSDFFEKKPTANTANNSIKTYRYWFDDKSSDYKEIALGALAGDSLLANLDVESLSNGLHTISSMFKDANDLWSSAVTVFFTRGPITNKIFIEPKVYVKKATLNVGDVQTITGSDFTSNGQIQLTIKNSLDEVVGDTIALTYINYGKFTYSLPITNSFQDGEYKVYASDVTTGSVSPKIKFRVVNPVVQKLWIKEPSNDVNYTINQPIHISWQDMLTNSNTVGKTGFVTKTYKIEYSKDNGTWQLIDGSKTFYNKKANQSNIFDFSYPFPVDGSYKIKVTATDNSNNSNVSESFTVSSNPNADFTASLEWDQSFPQGATTISHPYGLAADGTSRVLIRLSRGANNKKAVKEIDAEITSLGNNFTGTILLGKTMYALNPKIYSEEANFANSTSTNPVFGIPSKTDDYWFWFVAPDDFTNVNESQENMRKAKITFKIIYTDNSTVSKEDSIKIVRPPLMLVHGLNGSVESFKNSQYNIGGNLKWFDRDNYKNNLWIQAQRVKLTKYASFEDNAKIILGITQDVSSPNTFQYQIIELLKAGYACNKVDYVCHSMGGCVARTAMNLFPDYYIPKPGDQNLPYKNYGKGFIHKLITLNTPHNGSYLADWVFDSYNDGITLKNHPLVYNLFGYGSYFGKLDGFFIPTTNTRYDVSPAILDLRAFKNGKNFTKTIIKNHLIGSDVDYNDNSGETYLFFNEGGNRAGFSLIYHILLGYHTSAHDYILQHYNNNEFLSNSDMVVQKSSQLPDKTAGDISNIYYNPYAQSTASILYGDVDRLVNHVDITDNIHIGNRIMALLNAPITSSYFANDIAENHLKSGTSYKSPSAINSTADSTISYIDTGYVKIVSPSYLTVVNVDSIVDINLLIKDTSNLKKVVLVFQGQYYESFSKIANQTINAKIHSDAIGLNRITVNALYDSSGFTIYHSDTTTLMVNSLDTLKGFYITPKTQNGNRNEILKFVNSAVYSNYIGTLNNYDAVRFSIADTSVVKFVDSTKVFLSKDTGTTFIVFNYRGFADTAFVYISHHEANTNITNLCPHSNTSFYAGTNDPNKTYHWQADTGKGYISVIDDTVYSGATTPTLTLSSPPTSLNGYSYRCIVSGINGSDTTAAQTLTFAITWTGAANSTWENTANWSCGSLPDENTDVIINSGLQIYPVLNSNASIRSLVLKTGATVNVANGFKLNITGKSQ